MIPEFSPSFRIYLVCLTMDKNKTSRGKTVSWKALCFIDSLLLKGSIVESLSGWFVLKTLLHRVEVVLGDGCSAQWPCVVASQVKPEPGRHQSHQALTWRKSVLLSAALLPRTVSAFHRPVQCMSLEFGTKKDLRNDSIPLWLPAAFACSGNRFSVSWSWTCLMVSTRQLLVTEGKGRPLTASLVKRQNPLYFRRWCPVLFYSLYDFHQLLPGPPRPQSTLRLLASLAQGPSAFLEPSGVYLCSTNPEDRIPTCQVHLFLGGNKKESLLFTFWWPWANELLALAEMKWMINAECVFAE